MSAGIEEMLRAVIREEVRGAIREELATQSLTTRTAYYDQNDNPLGKRPFLEAARRGDFASVKHGKRVLACREDVDRWLASRARSPRDAGAEDGGDVDELLTGAGLVATAVASPAPRRRR